MDKQKKDETKKVLIIGASGQLGSVLLRALQPAFRLFGTYVHEKNGKLLHLDLTNKEKLKQLLTKIKPDIVINTAAMTNVDKCEDFPEIAHKINVIGNQNIYKECLRLNAKLVYISTYYVFDGKKGYYLEDHDPHPLNIYAQTKIKAEKITLQNKQNLVIRPSKIYSYGYDKRNFLARTIQSLKQGVTVFVTNDQYTNPISAEDLAMTIKKLLEMSATGVYHAGGPDNLSNYDFAKITAKVFSLPISLIQAQSTDQCNASAARPAHCALVTEKLRKATHFSPRGIEENLHIYKKQERYQEEKNISTI